MRAAALALALLACGARRAEPAPLLGQGALRLVPHDPVLVEDGDQLSILCPITLSGGPPVRLVRVQWAAVGAGLSVQGEIGPLDRPLGAGQPPLELLLAAALPALAAPGNSVEVSGTVHLRTGLGTERRHVFSARLPLGPAPHAPLESP